MTKIKEYKTASGETTYWFSHYTGKNREPGIPKEIVKRGFKDKEEAEFELAKLKLSLKKRSYEAPDNRVITFEEVYREWDLGYVNTVRETTYNMTSQQFKKYIIPTLGKRNIKNITITECQQLVNEWSKVYTNFKVLKSAAQRVFDHAVISKYTTDNPMKFVKMPKRNQNYSNESDKKFYDVNELKMFLDTLSDNFTIKEVTMIHLLAFTGMRKGELGGLYWSDVDFKNKTIRIGKNLAYVNKSYKTYDPKTKKSNRVIKIPDIIVNILKTWKKKQAEELLAYGINPNQKEQWVFSMFYADKINAPIHPETTNNIISKVLKINRQLPHITPHGFRHTYASILIESGTEMKEIQEHLGHASMSITGDTYGHLTEKAKENTANKFAEALNL
ncbi:tyrosine-type recombinase/integrase [Enterococcus casseliflavus]|uniref:tyrosine-type recombinase/integrase n=1 Tax=Enterococcus casseliflavus TaxID=37734 RepID=UPI00201CC4F6|nr:site-specific integrase [Enterococcus casseliflavus]UQZ98753.1 site-specific integrase [Enterococcus casseliflavus]